MHRQVLLAGGEPVQFDLSTHREMPSTCHVTLLELITIPASLEIQLPVHLSGEEGVVMHSCLAVLDPSQEFSERLGALIAHSLSYTGAEKTHANYESLTSTGSGTLTQENRASTTTQRR